MGMLRVKVDGRWQDVTGGPAGEVAVVSSAPPQDSDAKVWYDTTTSPPRCKVRVNGVWEEVAAAAGYGGR